jgi:hypothetical protein
MQKNNTYNKNRLIDYSFVEIERNDPDIEQKIKFLEEKGWFFDHNQGNMAIFKENKNPFSLTDKHLKFYIIGLVFVVIFIVWILIVSL